MSDLPPQSTNNSFQNQTNTLFIEDCNNVQKRLVLYHKCFHFLYGYGHKGYKFPPSCMVLRIQSKYKGDYIQDEEIVEDTTIKRGGLVSQETNLDFVPEDDF